MTFSLLAPTPVSAIRLFYYAFSKRQKSKEKSTEERFSLSFIKGFAQFKIFFLIQHDIIICNYAFIFHRLYPYMAWFIHRAESRWNQFY